MTLLFLQSNESVMKDTRFPAKAITDTHDSHDMYRYDYRGAGELCKKSLSTGRPNSSRHSARVR